MWGHMDLTHRPEGQRNQFYSLVELLPVKNGSIAFCHCAVSSPSIASTPLNWCCQTLSCEHLIWTNKFKIFRLIVYLSIMALSQNSLWTAMRIMTFDTTYTCMSSICAKTPTWYIKIQCGINIEKTRQFTFLWTQSALSIWEFYMYVLDTGIRAAVGDTLGVHQTQHKQARL